MQRMTEEEIRRSHRLAKNQSAQISILGDLNGVSPKIIRRIVNGNTWDEATGTPISAQECAPKKCARGRLWTYKELEELANLRKERKTLAEIAATLGRTKSAVSNAILQHPEMFPTRKLYRQFSPDEEEYAIEAYRSGEAIYKISKKLGRAQGTLRTFFIRKGLML